MFFALHHVQLAMPKGGEAEALAFYQGVLGLTPVEKPATLQARGGVWFESGALRLHLGIETPFMPAKKAHPALETADLSAVIAVLQRHQIAFQPDADLPGIRRLYVADPFGNRLELLERMD